MATLTKQALRASLYSCLELGYIRAERGDNLEAVKIEAGKMIESLVEVSDNCPHEVLRVHTQFIKPR